MKQPEMRIFEDSQKLAESAAWIFVETARRCVESQGQCTVVLSGGSTPRAMFKLLAGSPFREDVDWSKIHFFWGDERNVPANDSASNYRAAYLDLLSHVAVPEEQVHRIRGEMDPRLAANHYEAVVRDFFGAQSGAGSEAAWPAFDLVYLGMGADGHTASLFPHTAALQEATRWVVANHVSKLDTWRVTLTAPAINAAAHVVFLVAGADKRQALQAVLEGADEPERLPAQLIRPAAKLEWLVDQAAAADLADLK